MGRFKIEGHAAWVAGLKQEAPEEEDAQEQDERDDDDLNQAHNRFLCGASCRGRETKGGSNEASF
jgi:hypothetical protein